MPRSAFLLAALLLCGNSSAATALDALADRFDADFQRHLEQAGIPGGAYALVQDDRIVLARGHGVRARAGRDAVDADTVFRIASVSKTFAAELTGLLVQEGKLRWDDPVNRYLPDFRFKTPGRSNALQVQHLLGQSSGLIPNAYDNLLEADLPIDRIIPRFRELDPYCQPGRCYGYQNVLFSLIGPIIEQAADDSYARLISRRIFQPLEMRHASVGMDAFLAAGNRALPHIRRGGEWVTGEIERSYYRVLPAAGVNASANDLGKWLIAQMGHRPDVIPSPLVDEVTKQRVRTQKDLRRRSWREYLQDAHYGLGWRIYRVNGEDLIYHGGWVKGYVADIAYSRSRRVGLVVLLNAESSVINEITTSFWAQVLQPEPSQSPPRRAASVP